MRGERQRLRLRLLGYNEEERIELMNRFITIFGKGVIYDLLADREFIGDIWIKYLIAQETPFDIRIKMVAEVWS